MPYGRLDVFWPDGQFQTFPLSETTSSVGRSSGNTIALETENISRYHFTLRRDGDKVLITDLDSVNGTYVDGVRIPNNEPQPLYGGEEILVGDLRMIFTSMDDSPTRPMLVPEDTTQRIEMEAPAFRIDLKPPPQGVAPGAHISGELTISNTSSESERYLVEVTGLPRDWVRIDRPSLEIDPGDTELVVISFKPVRRSESAPGDYHVNLTVRPRRETMQSLNADLILTVLPFGGFGMALERREIRGDERFRLHLHNQGSSPLPLSLTVRGTHDDLASDLSSSQVTLAPGQRLLMQGKVLPKKVPMYGESEQYPFDIVIRSLDAAAFTAAQRAYVVVQPRLPRWTPLAALGAITALALIVVLALVVLSTQTLVPTTPPDIERFAVSSAEVTAGEPLVVSWVAENASQVTITVNGDEVFNNTQDIGADSTMISTEGLNGAITVEMSASNAIGESTASETVSVLSPVRVAEFRVEPRTLVRNVVQPISVSWNVAGATTTRITGLESFTNSRIEPTYGAQATLPNLAGIPTSPLTITLYAEDAQGNAAEQSVVVDVIDPVCRAAQDDVFLLSEPNPDAQAVATLPDNTSVVVDAQDETRQWLRVQLPGGVNGWGPLSSFECADTFEVGNLRQILVVPTIVPTLTDTGATDTPEPLVTATPRPTSTQTPNPTALAPTATSSSGSAAPPPR